MGRNKYSILKEAAPALVFIFAFLTFISLSLLIYIPSGVKWILLGIFAVFFAYLLNKR